MMKTNNGNCCIMAYMMKLTIYMYPPDEHVKFSQLEMKKINLIV